MIYLIPERLETERLVLRMFLETDWRDMHRYYGDAECTRHTSGTALKEPESWQKVASLLGHWQMRGYGSYALEEKATTCVLGVVGLDYPLDWPEPEIQWGLSRASWGKGFASEAVRAVQKIAKQYLPDLSLISLIHPNNINSINLAVAVGASFEKEYYFRNDTWSIYRHA